MNLSKSIKPMRMETYPRRYAVISIKGQRKLACFVEDEWIIDSTCKTINEMVEQGLLCEDAVIGWVTMQPSTSEH